MNIGGHAVVMPSKLWGRSLLLLQFFVCLRFYLSVNEEKIGLKNFISQMNID